MSDSHTQQALEWMDRHEMIPKDKCGYRLSQTVEQCHAYQRVRGRCRFECKYRLNAVGRLKPGYSKFNQRGVFLVDAGK